ncbi:MAG: class E sortase [Saccharothrix sp.]|nr:class E sortase [Saccharothrix sp.]
MYADAWDSETRPDSHLRLVLQDVVVMCAVVLLLFVVYQDWGRAGVIRQWQGELDRRLDEQWRGGGSTLPGRLHIPALDAHLVVVEGVDPGSLDRAPGHYPATSQPGQAGNAAIAGLRTRGLFRELHRLRDGDAVIFETASSWLTYEVYLVHTVDRADRDALAAVPDHPNGVLTLTTSDRFRDPQHRLVVHAALVEAVDKSAGRPARLDG